jgi:hypothetical protein
VLGVRAAVPFNFFRAATEAEWRHTEERFCGAEMSQNLSPTQKRKEKEDSTYAFQHFGITI